MSHTKLSLNGGDHALVAERIAVFYDAFPDGRIITELVSRADGAITFKASVYRSASDVAPAATGWAAERDDDGDVNACLENTETSAIGRALANLGFTTPQRRPTVVEKEKVDRATRTPSPLGIGTRPPEPPSFPQARVKAPSSSVAAPATGTVNAGEHAGREAIADVLALLETAERSGYSAERSQAVRLRLAGGDVPAPSLLRVERALRRWLADRVENRA
jgi:hypothetical protein